MSEHPFQYVIDAYNLKEKSTEVYGIYLNELNKLSEHKSEKENIRILVEEYTKYDRLHSALKGKDNIYDLKQFKKTFEGMGISLQEAQSNPQLVDGLGDDLEEMCKAINDIINALKIGSEGIDAIIDIK